MSIYPILNHPDKRLRLIAEPVTDFSEQLVKITDAMFATMYHAKGIGLAATQVNIQQRIVVMDVPLIKETQIEDANTDTKSKKLILINPEVLFHSKETTRYEEGCLSVPGQYAYVTRPANIRFSWQDLSGTQHESDADGLLAICIQHEIDHLNGTLFIDHLSRLKRERLEKKLANSLKSI